MENKKRKKALRFEVEEQVNEWKREHPWKRGAICPLTGQVMKKAESEVDHVVPFAKIVDDFLLAYNLEITDLEIGFDCQISRWFLKNSRLRENWREYHTRHAELRYVSKQANKQRGDAGYRKRKREIGKEKDALTKQRKGNRIKQTIWHKNTWISCLVKTDLLY
jgi:hypothetical protein